MAEPIGALRAELSAGHAQFSADMKKAKDAVQKNATGMSAAMGKVGKKFTEAATALNRYAGYAVLAAATAMAVFVKKQIDIADKMGKLAQATGTTSEYLSSMALVASQGGTTLEVVAKGVRKLSQNMDDVRRGTGEALDAFEDLNIRVTDSAGVLRKSDQVMLDIADKFKGMEDGAEKTAYAMAIFGRAGAELIPMLNGGRDGIEQLQKKAQEMGLVISTKTALEAAYLNDQLDIMMKTVQGTGRSIALDLIPWFNETLAVMKLAKEESGTLMAAWVGLGAVGDAIFGSSTQQKINSAKKEIQALTAAQERLSSQPKAMLGLSILGGVDLEGEISKAKAELASLEVQKEAEDKADEQRMQNSLERYQKEADARRKNTEAMITAMEARIRKEEESKQASIEKEQAWKDELAADIATYEAIQKMLDDINEGVKASEETLKGLADTGKDSFDELKAAIEGWGKDSADAIVKFARTGEMSFKEMIDSMINDLLRMMVYQNITKPLFGAISGGIGSLFGGAAGAGATSGALMIAAKGAAFRNGNLVPFAHGGIVDRPTVFPMARGAGLMGEAGAEAVMPLTRIGGDLGVKAQIGSTSTESESQPMTVNVAITAVDAASFQDLMRRNPGLIVEPIVTALTSQGHRPLINAVKGVM